MGFATTLVVLWNLIIPMTERVTAAVAIDKTLRCSAPGSAYSYNICHLQLLSWFLMHDDRLVRIERTALWYATLSASEGTLCNQVCDC